ncbi:MAG TPA: cyclomaltodextrinase N-terminal domain-containing protein, partial [Woeseiaceae bacterium]|nr:cyclomaltodextrinase N-terminal domain-containing protein [Woeseiaceae bacterium]
QPDGGFQRRRYRAVNLGMNPYSRGEGALTRRWLITLAMLLVSDAGAAYHIEHLEPAFWWTGMRDGTLEILMHGERIAELELTPP